MKIVSQFATVALALVGASLTTQANACETMMFSGVDGTYPVFATTLPGVGKVPVRGLNGAALAVGTRRFNPNFPRIETNTCTGANTIRGSGKYLLTGKTWSADVFIPEGEQQIQLMTPGTKAANDQPEYYADKKRKHPNE